MANTTMLNDIIEAHQPHTNSTEANTSTTIDSSFFFHAGGQEDSLELTSIHQHGEQEEQYSDEQEQEEQDHQENDEENSDRSTEHSDQDNEECDYSDQNYSDNDPPYNSDGDDSHEDDWLGKRKKKQQYPRYYSFAFYRLTDSKNRIGSTAKAQLSIQKSNGETVDIHVQLDSGGSQNLASRSVLQNIRKAHDYGRTPIYMVTVSGDTPAYRNMGELHFTDAEGNPIVLLCFVQEQAIKGHDDFALICSDTLVDIKADINYHAETSKQGKVLSVNQSGVVDRRQTK